MATVMYELSSGCDEPLSTVTDTTTPVCPTYRPDRKAARDEPGSPR